MNKITFPYFCLHFYEDCVCLVFVEFCLRFMITTPIIIKNNPKTFILEIISLKKKTPTKAAPAVPSPAQMLYPTLKETVFKAKTINKKDRA